MQRLFVKPAADEPLIVQPAAELATWRRREGWLWLDVVRPSVEEVQQLGRTFGFDPLALQDVVEESQFPKVDDYGSYLFVVLHGLGTATERLETTELDAFLGPDYLVTFREGELPAVDWVADQALRNPAVAEGGPDRMLTRLAEAAARRYLPLLDSLEERIAELEDRAVAAHPSVIPEIQALRRDVILLRHIVAPQRDLLLVLSREGSSLVEAATRRRFADVYDHHHRLAESLDAYRLLLATVLDTYRGSVAERMNEVMKVLTVFTAVLLPLSLIAGVYGMNFEHIPELGWRWGYFGVLGVMALLGLGLWGYFARRGFVGGPRLRRLPRAVGLGLASLAALPVRTVGWLLFEEPETHHDGLPPSTPPPPSR